MLKKKIKIIKNIEIFNYNKIFKHIKTTMLIQLHFWGPARDTVEHVLLLFGLPTHYDLYVRKQIIGIKVK